MLRIDVRSSRELQALILAMRQADREVAAQIRRQTQGAILGAWRKGLAEHAETRLEHRVLVESSRVSVSNQNVTLKAGTLAKKLSGGAKVSQLSAAAEFGANRNDRTTYPATSRRGKNYNVTRRTKAQFRPRKRTGYVAYPTAADLIPKFAALWVQTAVRELHEIIEKRGQ